MKQFVYLCCFVTSLLIATNAEAKIWRVNNNAGVVADFTTVDAAVNNAAVVNGDTLHIEPSATPYTTGSITLTKRLVFIGAGFLLNPADVTFPGNVGLQATIHSSRIASLSIGNGAQGSRFIGITFNNGLTFQGNALPQNILIEKCWFASTLTFTTGNNDGVTVRKSYFYNTSITATNAGVVLSNFICENNIFQSTFGHLNLQNLTGSGNIIRNNSFYEVSFGSTVNNAYFANNIVDAPTFNFTNCTIKNNLFSTNQALPGTATNNQVSVVMNNVYVKGTTGSLDSRLMLKPGSPAIGAGLTIGTVVNPDCGAFGATDSYKLSGIPNIPSIYSMTVPNAIPAGSATMNVTFSTRNNN